MGDRHTWLENMSPLLEKQAVLETTTENTSLASIAVSMKRIADVLERVVQPSRTEFFLQKLYQTLDDVSQNHAQRMR